MNIFVLDEDPVKAAQAMDCVRVPKRVRESEQMMASGLRKHGATDEDFIKRGVLTKSNRPYKGGDHFHPCTVWTSVVRANFHWLADHAIQLCKEYTIRFGKTHACEQPIKQMADMCYIIPRFNPETSRREMTPFAQAMPDEYKDDDPVVAYRAYYMSKMDSPGGVHYRHTSPPDWWEVNA